MIEFQDADSAGRVWTLPGGGIEVGESASDAARREVFEETGIGVDGLDVFLRRHRQEYRWHGSDYVQFETWFVAVVNQSQISDRFRDEDERSEITGARWWTAQELGESTARFRPHELAQLVASLLCERGGLPPQHS